MHKVNIKLVKNYCFTFAEDWGDDKMNTNELQNKIDELIKDSNYKELYTYSIKSFEKMNTKEIINIVKFKKLLLNDDYDSNKKSKLIEPLKKYLDKKNIPLQDYIECCNCFNLEYKKLKEYKQNELDNIYKYNFGIVFINILSKIEDISHENMKKCNELELSTTENLRKRENLINEYQCIIEGLSLLLKDLFENKEKFRVNRFVNKELFLSNIQKCNKKVFKKYELYNYITSIINLKNVVEQVQNYDIRLETKDRNNNIFFEYKNLDEYKKKRIAGIRCSIHDFNHQLEYNSSIESKMDKKLDWNKLIDFDDKNFRIKFNFFSDEVISIMIECYNEFKFQIKEMQSNCFLGREINNKIIGKNVSYDITYKDALNFYFMLELIAFTYFKATEIYIEKYKRSPIIPFFVGDIDLIMQLTQPAYKYLFNEIITKSKLEELIKLYKFSQDGIFDLYYKPIIENNDTLIIIPSIIKANNFNRTFIEHMNIIDANFKQGIIYEEYFKTLFKKNMFRVYDKKSPRLNFDMGNDEKGDIDILMMKGNYIFCSQLKNRSNPIESKDYIAFDRKINKKAIKQLNYAKKFLNTNPKFLTEFFDIDDFGKYQIIPFIITNSFYASGDKRNGVYITDTSSLSVLLDKGEICIKDCKGNLVYQKLIKKTSIEEELKNHLQKPYFKDEYLYYNLYTPRAYPVNNSLYIFKVSDEIISDHKRLCYLKDF